jgi:hypothetical protein
MSARRLARSLLSPARRALLRRALGGIGYDDSPWARVVMYEEMDKLIAGLDPSRRDCLEISGSRYKDTGFRSYRSLQYPDFDVCRDPIPAPVDLIIADQVWEHLLWPYRAARTVLDGLRPGGRFLIATPFLIRVHANPTDCSRWTEIGLRHFLAEAGFPIDRIVTGSWGNRACVRANLDQWARRGFGGSLVNEPNYPVVVWALAEKA